MGSILRFACLAGLVLLAFTGCLQPQRQPVPVQEPPSFPPEPEASVRLPVVPPTPVPLPSPAPALEPLPVSLPAPESPPSQAPVSSEAVPVEVLVRAFNWGFEPSTIEVNQGEWVRLVVSTQDGVHGLAIPAFGVSQKLEPGKTTVAEFKADKAGHFPFYCNVSCGSGHSDMRGTLVVKPVP
ncbi:MAG TPA: hypothetical protein HA252_02775 [Candidatus Diapherotrites archaeon]|uniref:Cupredoxin domain-containing protein n=1 Tax=Candidatus Iainarchaeum sp. TaxID=3101447 RepID=A0A7J4JEV7_9ARCH|nr:cupredoxin domain-containing protein [Candidatus Diapherotrites archaeon]HIH16302.1 hypothetical protein [Candidatus Diapherotrites archaeon]